MRKVLFTEMPGGYAGNTLLITMLVAMMSSSVSISFPPAAIAAPALSAAGQLAGNGERAQLFEQIKAGRCEAVIGRLQTMVKANPKDSEAVFYLALALAGSGKNQEAKHYLLMCETLEPRSFACQWQLYKVAKDLHDLPLAEKALRAAVDLKPDDGDIVYNLGNILSQQKKTKEAAECYRKACSLLPQDADAFFNLGLALKELGEYEEAAAAFRKSVEIAPAADGFSSLGQALHLCGRGKEAIEALKQSAEFRPGDFRNWTLLGICQKQQGDLAGAEESYMKAASLAPEQPAAWEMLATLRMSQKNYSGAEEAATKLVEISNKNARGWLLSGICQFRQKKYKEAEKSLRKAIDLEPQSASGCIMLASMFKEQSKCSDSEKWAKMATQREPNNPNSWGILGQALEGLGKKEQAEDVYATAKRLQEKR